MSRLDELFERCRAENRAALIGYLPVGFPSYQGSVEAMLAMVEGGVDAVEVGMPYTDPGMDGPIIQVAVDQARCAPAAGWPTSSTPSARSPRRHPGLVMGYWNPIEKYGRRASPPTSRQPVASGAITPDLIPEEATPWIEPPLAEDLDPVFLVAPSSTDERIAVVGRTNRGFVYAASTMGVTGTRSTVGNRAQELVARTRAQTDLPVCVGLGVSNGDQAAEVAALRRRRHRRLGAGLGAAARRSGGGPASWPATSPRGSRRRGDRVSYPQPFVRGARSSGRCRCGPTRSASCSVPSSRSCSASGAGSRAAAEKGVIADMAAVAVPFGLRRVPDLPRRDQPGGVPRGPGPGALHLAGRARHLGRHRSVGCSPAAWFVLRRRGISFVAVADTIAPGVAVAQAIGRFGNYFNQELYGRPTTLPWALEIDGAHWPDGYADVETYHPTFLYESLWNVGVGGLVMWADHRFRLSGGRAFALYVALYAVGRGWIEALRIDDADHFLGLRLNDYVTAVVLARRRRLPRRPPGHAARGGRPGGAGHLRRRSLAAVTSPPLQTSAPGPRAPTTGRRPCGTCPSTTTPTGTSPVAGCGRPCSA